MSIFSQSRSLSDPLLKKYFSYLKFEKNLLENSVEAYLRDVIKLKEYTEEQKISLPQLSRKEIINFLATLQDLGIGARSQARILSGIKSFYKFLMLEDYIQVDPTDLIEGPKLGLKLPEVLSLTEINWIIQSFDVSISEGQRNRAIIETLYSCGLRVSELVSLTFSNIYKKEGYLIIKGKGEKSRIVPIAPQAIDEIERYLAFRNEGPIKKDAEDYVFLSRLGKPLSRIAIFQMIKKQVALVGIHKCVSPHTFRHAFATHLLEGGANLRAIQIMLGHEKISTTEVYLHLDRTLLREEILLHHPRNRKHTQTLKPQTEPKEDLM